jgi:hypothetical protein
VRTSSSRAEASTPVTRERRAGSLAPWVIAPLVGLILLVVVETQLVSHSCEPNALRGQPLGVLFEVLGVCGGLALSALAVWRWTLVVGTPDAYRGLDRRTVFVVLVVAIAGAVYGVRDNEWIVGIFLGAVLFGALVTIATLFALIVALLRGRRSDQVGPLLSIYLLGAGLCGYLPVFLFGAARVGGCFE